MHSKYCMLLLCGTRMRWQRTSLFPPFLQADPVVKASFQPQSRITLLPFLSILSSEPVCAHFANNFGRHKRQKYMCVLEFNTTTLIRVSQVKEIPWLLFYHSHRNLLKGEISHISSQYNSVGSVLLSLPHTCRILWSLFPLMM